VVPGDAVLRADQANRARAAPGALPAHPPGPVRWLAGSGVGAAADGQCAEHYATQADATQPTRWRTLSEPGPAGYGPIGRADSGLDLIHSDPLAALLRVPALTDPDAGVDLARIPVGRTETGRAWVLRLLDRHVLVGRAERPDPVDPDGRVQVFGIDPKGGMFQGWGGWWVCRVVCTRWVSGVSRRW